MIVVTINEFLSFIKSQPDDKELNFNEFRQHSPCGCPMIHYAREVFKENNLNASGTDWYGRTTYNSNSTTYAQFEDGFHLMLFMPSVKEIDMLPKTYGELKQYLKEKFPEFNWENNSLIVQ